MKLYCVEYNERIKEVESERQTEASVFVNGNRSAWKSDWTKFFTTMSEAKEFLINLHQEKLDYCKKQVENAEKRLHQIKEKYA